jgi:hypothetical protein
MWVFPSVDLRSGRDTLQQAPVSLAGALEEYIEDPSFEQNRIEYRTNKEAADRGSKKSTSTSKAKKPERCLFSSHGLSTYSLNAPET